MSSFRQFVAVMGMVLGLTLFGIAIAMGAGVWSGDFATRDGAQITTAVLMVGGIISFLIGGLAISR